MKREEIEKNSERKSYQKIKDIELLDINPRYTDIVEIDWNDVKEFGNVKNQDSIAIELLKYEEDFTSFKTLIKSLSRGYNQDYDQIICLQTKNKKFIVVEGNRRMLACKMMANFEWAKYILGLLKNSVKLNPDSALVSNSDDDELDGDFKNRLIEIETLEKLLENISNDENCKIKEDTNVISQTYLYKEEKLTEDEQRVITESILHRSVSAPGGKLRWPRFQTLKNTMDVYRGYAKQFQNATVDELYEKTADFLNKSISSTITELRNATFIFILKDNYSGKYKDVIDWKSLRTSAIELSINTIDIDSIVGKKNLSEFYEITWVIGDNFLNSLIEEKKLSNFLIDNFKDGNYSTRGWKKNKNKKNLYEFLNIPYQPNNFSEIMKTSNSNSFEIVKNIIEVNKEIQSIYKNIDEKIKRGIKTSTDEFEQSPQNILRQYVRRVLAQEYYILTLDLESMDEETYPYYSLASIGRSFFELILSYIFAIDSNIRKELYSNPLNNVRPDFITKFSAMTDKQIFEEIYKKFDTDFVSTNMKKAFSKLGSTDYEKLHSLLLNSVFFTDRAENFKNIFDAYNNNEFNMTIHKPYWLNFNNNLSEIEKVIKNVLIIIKNVSIILGLN